MNISTIISVSKSSGLSALLSVVLLGLPALNSSRLHAQTSRAASPNPQGESSLAENWLVENINHKRTLGTAAGVVVNNLLGGVKVRNNETDNLEVYGVSQRHRLDNRKPEIKVSTASDGRLSIEVMYLDGPDPVESAWAKRRTDIVVLVPGRLGVEVHTDRGSIEVRGFRGPVEAYSRTADIRVMRTAGPVMAQSDHGDIFVSFHRVAWKTVSDLETLSGSIRVELPRRSSLQATLETYGEITTDFSLIIDRNEETFFKVARASIGDATRILKMRSNRGAISLIASSIRQLSTTE